MTEHGDSQGGRPDPHEHGHGDGGHDHGPPVWRGLTRWLYPILYRNPASNRLVVELAALTAGYACNGCKHLCEKAVPTEVAIAAPLRYLMYAECYGKTEHARDLYRAIPAAARNLPDSQLARASAVCPQGIDIPARLRRARELLA